MRPTNAFLVVDVQNDFISGSLNISNCSAQHNGAEVKYPVVTLMKERHVPERLTDGEYLRVPVHLLRIGITLMRCTFLLHFTLSSQVLAPINKLLDSVDFDSVFYSLDWHPSDHVSFIDNIKKRALHTTSAVDADNAQVYDTVVFSGPPPMKQKLWPRHCVQDSWGSELHKDLKVGVQ